MHDKLVYMGFLSKKTTFVAIALFVCTLFFSLGLFTTTYAEVSDLTGVTSLEISPEIPTPGSTVDVTLSAYTMNLNGASITWAVNGVAVPERANERTLQLKIGTLGTNYAVKAVITPAGGAPVSVSRTLTASDLDLIVESNTTVPSFYKGRALPMGDELVRVTSILHTGKAVNVSALTYTWRLGNTVLFEGPVRGRDSVVFTMPKSATNLSVDIADATGNIVMRKAVRLTPAKPELHFYEDNPLRGLSLNAIRDSLTLVGSETTVRAEPYFVSADILDKEPRLTWTIDGKTITNKNPDPLTITLRATEGAGAAKIGFELINTTSFLQFVQGAFTINFQN